MGQHPRHTHPTIRAATGSDTDALRDLIVDANLPTANFERHVHGFILAEVDHRPIACAGVERYGSHALLRSVVVKPNHRGGGLGRHLVARMIDRLEALGATDLWLLTESAADWFTRQGFVEQPREAAPEVLQASTQFSGACPDDAVFMHRPC